MNLSRKVLRNDDEIVSRDMGGETFIISLTTGELHRPNPVGRCIWKAIDGKRSVGEIIAVIAKTFCGQVDAETVASDVLRFVDSLEVHNLVRLSDE